MKDMSHQFLDWLRSKPADEEYDYGDPGSCAICQFLFEAGYAETPRVVPRSWRDGLCGTPHQLPARMDVAAMGIGYRRDDDTWVSLSYERTFGAAAYRLERLLAS